MNFIYTADALVVIPPCCETPHIRPAFVQCAGANYNPDQVNQSAKKSVTCSACKAEVNLDDLTLVGRIPQRKPPAPVDWEQQDVPAFIRRDGESVKQFMQRVYDTRTPEEQARDEPLPPEFMTDR
ncbi:hypothetical protein [Limnohabitans sp. DM1]|uniref:hypothetical protein n=1 Tax=Limnohabitans sp. DM1 TaxID=1597955 RepID=UPI000B7F5ED5|nr:hypothetical protein [Limnohabitans sp. DM1]